MEKTLLLLYPHCGCLKIEDLRLVSRSKDGQDILAAMRNNFKKSGFFVEFGGADGLVGSNTFFLEKVLKWRGVIAEPCRAWHQDLHKNRSCYISEKCVYSETGSKVMFHENRKNRELSTIGSLADAPNAEQYEVETISLNDLLDEANAPYYIDYLSIDTEGSELKILESINWSVREFDLITIEHNHKADRNAMQKLLGAQGYKRVFGEISRNEDWFISDSLALRKPQNSDCA